jgi:hypothetical protein
MTMLVADGVKKRLFVGALRELNDERKAGENMAGLFLYF